MKGRSPRGETKREDIRRAAYTCFRRSGYHATSVDDICEAAKTSKGSFYWHYQSKQEVFIDILETWTREVMDQLYEQFEEAVIGPNYPRTISEALARELKRGKLIGPLWVEFLAQAGREPEIQAALSKFHRRARAAITAILRPAVDQSCTGPELEAASATIFGAYIGLLMQDMTDPDRVPALEQVNIFMGLLGRIFGRLPPGPPVPPPPAAT